MLIRKKRPLMVMIASLALIACQKDAGKGAAAEGSKAAAASKEGSKEGSEDKTASKSKDAKDGDSSKTAAHPKEHSASMGESKVSVKLLKAGGNPKEELRLKLTKGDEQTVAMTMNMTQEMAVGAKKMPSPSMPTTTITMRSKVKDVGKESATIDYEIIEAKAMKDKKIDARVAKAIDESLAGIVGLKGEIKIDQRGFVKQHKVNIPDSASPEVKAVMKSMRDSMKNMTSPFPKEAVGVGAQWEVSQNNIKSGEIRISQTSLHTLKSRKGAVIVTDSTLKQSAKKQEMKSSSMPKGTKMTLESIKGTGSGKSTLSLEHSMPTESQTQIKVDSEFSVEGAKGAEKMQGKMHLDMSTKAK